MAYYEIVRACGHIDEVNITGTNVRGERERRAAYLATLDCSACVQQVRQHRHQQLAEAALRYARLAGWPDLTGSPKQVAWAQDIRMSLVACAVAAIYGNNAGDSTDATLNQVINEVAHEFGKQPDDDRDWGAADREPIVRTYVTAMLRQTEARWWIDRRDLALPIRTPSDWVNSAGAARMQYGGILAAVEAVMTSDERARLGLAVAS